MAKINLLPWRAERRKQRQKEFLTLLGICGLFGVAAAFGGMQYFDAQIENQQARNTLLQNEITALDARIVEIQDLERQRAALLARKEVIEQLQANRSQMVHLFSEMVKTIPEGVRLTSIKQAGNLLSLDGVAQSNARVSSYMRSLERSGWMTNPDLSIIEAKGGDPLMPYQFMLRVSLTNPNKKDDDDAVASAGGMQ
jgi:type IV pilus assembly protein PilN